MRVTDTVVAVVVTHRRRELLAQSLEVLTTQSRPVDHLVVIDNGDEQDVGDLVAAQSVPTTYLGSKHNLGGAGGFARGLIFGIGETGPEARAGFDADRMARRHELTHGFRGQGHAPFLILDFLG